MESAHVTFKRPNQGFRRFTYVPSLNFKTCCFRYRGGSLISLLVFFYCIFPFLCRCRIFNPSLNLLIPKLLQELDPRSRDFFEIWVGLTANTLQKLKKKCFSFLFPLQLVTLFTDWRIKLGSTLFFRVIIISIH